MAAKSDGKTLFCKKSPVDSADTLRVKKVCQNHSILLCFQDKRIIEFNAEIQDGHQKWRENVVMQKVISRQKDTLWVKNFIKIVLSCSISEINVFLHRNSRWPSKVAGKIFLEISRQ